MSAFDSLFADTAAPTLVGHLGEAAAATYAAADGAEKVEIEDPILGAEQHDELATDDGRQQRILREAIFRRYAGGPFETALPALNAVVTIAGVAWAVESIVRATATFVTVKLTRRPSVEQSRSQYRKKT
jgi:hypothetical protein